MAPGFFRGSESGADFSAALGALLDEVRSFVYTLETISLPKCRAVRTPKDSWIAINWPPVRNQCNQSILPQKTRIGGQGQIILILFQQTVERTFHNISAKLTPNYKTIHTSYHFCGLNKHKCEAFCKLSTSRIKHASDHPFLCLTHIYLTERG